MDSFYLSDYLGKSISSLPRGEIIFPQSKLIVFNPNPNTEKWENNFPETIFFHINGPWVLFINTCG